MTDSQKGVRKFANIKPTTSASEMRSKAAVEIREIKGTISEGDKVEVYMRFN